MDALQHGGGRAISSKDSDFRGKNIGWLKADILEWMARTSRYRVATTSDKTIALGAANQIPQPATLPLKYPQRPR